MIIGISGKIGAGKDLTGKIFQYLADKQGMGLTTLDSEKDFGEYCKGIRTNQSWEIKKFADALKDIACILIGCTRKDLENVNFKNSFLDPKWNITVNSPGDAPMTVRTFLQKLGTDALRTNLHPNTWVNALMSKYKDKRWVNKAEWDFHKTGKYNPKDNLPIYPNWIITDVRFLNEATAIKEAGGVMIRVSRDPIAPLQQEHISETALDDYKGFDYLINNNRTIEHLIIVIKSIYGNINRPDSSSPEALYPGEVERLCVPGVKLAE